MLDYEIYALLIIGFFSGGMLVFAFMMFWRIYQDRRWPIRIPLLIQRGRTVVWDLTERGRHVTRKDETEAIQFKNNKKTIAPPKYEQVGMNIKGKPVYPMFSSINGQYFPIKLSDKKKAIEIDVVEDKSAKNWAIGELRRLVSVYAPKEGWLAKYGVFIMNATFAAMVIFFVIYFSGKIELSSNALASGAGRMADAMEALAAKG